MNTPLNNLFLAHAVLTFTLSRWKGMIYTSTTMQGGTYILWRTGSSVVQATWVPIFLGFLFYMWVPIYDISMY